jgi:hypothetical protein
LSRTAGCPGCEKTRKRRYRLAAGPKNQTLPDLMLRGRAYGGDRLVSDTPSFSPPRPSEQEGRREQAGRFHPRPT